MKRFKNILVLLGGVSEHDPALRRAAALAASNQARLTLALCLEEFGREGPSDELRQVIVDGLRKRLLALADTLRQSGHRVDVKLMFGRTFIETIVLVLERQHDLVIKTARGLALRHPVLFGSEDLHILRKCPCPVWMIHPDGPSRARAGGVLAAVNSDTTNAEKQALNVLIMELATSLALREETPLHVLHAWNLPARNTLTSSPWLNIRKSEIERLAAIEYERHRESFERLIDHFRPLVPNVNVHFQEGEPEYEIPRMARELAVEVIVMATVGRTGVPGLIIGNTAETVLGQVDCSVLAVKPASFVSPVAA